MPPKKGDKLTQLISTLPVNGDTPAPTSNNGKDQKVVEFYMEMLEKHKRELGKEKLTVWMQVGSFFEVYGLVHNPDGTTTGNVWDVAADLDIKVAKKGQSVYDNPNIEVYMAGVKEEYAEPYLERLVDRNGWTVAVYTQEKISSSNKFERVLRQIISPGLNFESDTISNNFMYIYFKAADKPNRISLGKCIPLNIGIYFVDCISGNNGVMELYTKDINEYGVVFSELVKLITIKNPAELVIHLDITNLESYRQFTEQELFCNLTLFDKSVRYNKAGAPNHFSDRARQQLILEKAYQAYKGRMDIFQQLGIDSQFDYGRLTMCLALDYIFQHDANIIQLLDKPEILASSSSYMMLANNCLQQLDIIDPIAKQRISQLSRDSELNTKNKLGADMFNKRLTLLDILDKTKTVIGKRLFRQRLSIPITDPVELQKRYDTISYWQNIQRTYLATPGADSALSPIKKIRACLANIHDIPKFMRKLATGKFLPTNMWHFKQSLQGSIDLITLLNQYSTTTVNDILLTPEQTNSLIDIVAALTATFNMDMMNEHWSQVEQNFYNPGICSDADKLAAEIKTGVEFIDLLKIELTKLMNPNIISLPSGQIPKQDLLVGEDTNTKLGRYIWVNDKNKTLLDQLINKQPTHGIRIGQYYVTLNSITLTNLKKGRWHVATPYLDMASNGLTVSIDKLRKLLKFEFAKWQTQFYSEHNHMLHTVTEFIANMDITQCNVFIADAYGYHRPQIERDPINTTGIEHSYLQAQELRHPIVERIRQDVKFVTNDLDFGLPEQTGMLLFGLNSSGKSTTMKAVGCALIMAQAGMFVPAKVFRFWPYRYLFTRIRNNDDIYAGLSSFEVEMKEFKVILKYADDHGMILGDELCSGTETLDATALVASGLQQLCKRNASFLFATHLHFLSEIDCVTSIQNLRFYHLAVRQDPNPMNPDKLIYDRKLKPGNGPQSYGILVCKSMALDPDFIREAERIRVGIEAGEILSGFSNRLQGANELARAPTSHFNKEKIFQVCEVCCDERGEDIHHIGHQADCDSRGILADGSAHKNSKWNLVCLCKECHTAVHSNQISITGYVQTSQGIELEWFAQANNIDSHTYDNNLITVCTDIETSAPKVNSTDTGVTPPTEQISNSPQQLTTANITELIITLKSNGKTIRAIQHALNKQGIKMKLIDIEKY
jgi:DNA mismatch repair protein MutS